MIVRIVGLVVVAAVAYLGFQYFSKEEPQQVSGNPMADVILPTLSGAAQEGELAFNKSCSACHGKNAAGQDGVAPPLIHKIYEPSHHGDMAFVLAAKNGVIQHHWRFGNMQPVEGVSDEEMAKIITYVRTLQRANGIQ